MQQGALRLKGIWRALYVGPLLVKKKIKKKEQQHNSEVRLTAIIVYFHIRFHKYVSVHFYINSVYLILMQTS